MKGFAILVAVLTTPMAVWADGTFDLGEVEVTACGSFSVPLTTSDPGTSLGFDFEIAYDSNKAMATGAQLSSFTSDCFFAVNTLPPGSITISLACPTVRNGAGTLIDLIFDPIANGVSSVDFASCVVNESPCTAATSGEIDVTCFPTPTPTITPTPTQTPTVTPTPEIACTCQGDANKNGFVNFADFGSVQANFGAPAGPSGDGDANCNGFVNFSDFGAIQQNFGSPCP